MKIIHFALKILGNLEGVKGVTYDKRRRKTVKRGTPETRGESKVDIYSYAL
jgi:hypothetical protein